MQVQRIDGMFHFSYTKSSGEIREKAAQKVAALRFKIEERKERIKKIRGEYKITDAILIDLLEQAREASRKNDNKMSYSVSNAPSQQQTQGMSEEIIIGAGTVNNLLTESDFIKGEESQVKRLQLIARNLQDEETEWSNGKPVGHKLNESELEYLGF